MPKRCQISFECPESLRAALAEELGLQADGPCVAVLMRSLVRQYIHEMRSARAADDPRLIPPPEKLRPQSRPRERKPRPQRRGGKKKGVKDGDGTKDG